MADYVLEDGTEIEFNLSKINVREFRGMLDPKESVDISDEKLGRCAGLTLEEVQTLPFTDYQGLGAAFFRKSRNPLSQSPNSQSAST